MATNDNPATIKRPAEDDFDVTTGDINLEDTPPYDPRTEQAPFSVLRSQEWSTYKGFEEQLKQLLTHPTTGLVNLDKSLPGLIDNVNNRIGGREPEKINLCLTGPMGTGKSATLNSLFSVGPIAREGDLGGSCTLTSCIYQYRKEGQEAAFLAEVNFFNLEQRHEILSDYVAAYYYASRSDDEELDSDHKEDAEMNLDIRSEVLTAMTVLFGDRKQCSTKQHAREFLDKALDPNDKKIVRQLCSWCDELIVGATNAETVVSVSASTPGDLSSKLELFTAYSEDDDGNLTVSLTPMVSLINFHFDDPLTRLGITFLDTPGTSDYNRIRRRSANEHRKLRTHSAILSEESRVRDDSGISTEIMNMRRRGIGRALVVITKSDIIKDTTIPNGSRKDKERCHELEKDVKGLRKELSKTGSLERDAKRAKDHDRACKLAQEGKALRIRLTVLENEWTAHRINMRSESNKKALQEKLLEVTRSEVPIFSISNAEYTKHIEGYTATCPPVLGIEETNIPALRRLICTLPNEARLNEIKHQQEVDLPGLLSRVRLYTERSASDHMEEMDIRVKSYINRSREGVVKIFKDLDHEVSSFLHTLQEQEWTAKAAKVCDKWAREFSTGPFLTLLKRDGRRKGNRGKKGVNLTGDLINMTAGEVNAHFEKITPILKGFGTTMAEHMDDLATEMIHHLKGSEDDNGRLMSLGPFQRYVFKERARMRGHCITTFDVLVDAIDGIRVKLVSEEEDAFLHEIMRPIYAEVRKLKGGKDQKLPPPSIGWPAHRKSVLKDELTRPNGVWTSVYKNVESEFRKLLKREREDLTTTIQKIFEEFYSGFNDMCEIRDTTDTYQIQAQETLARNIGKAERMLNGPMHEAYQALEKAFRSSKSDQYGQMD